MGLNYEFQTAIFPYLFPINISFISPTFGFYVDNKQVTLFSFNRNHVLGGARGVMVIVVGNGHGDTSSNRGRDWLHFT